MRNKYGKYIYLIIFMFVLFNFSLNNVMAGSCVSGKSMVLYGQNYWCCPNSSDTITSVNGNLYCVNNNLHSDVSSVRIVSSSSGFVCQSVISNSENNSNVCISKLGSSWSKDSCLMNEDGENICTCSASLSSCAVLAQEPSTKVTKPNSSLCKSGLVYNGSTQQITNVTGGNGYSLSGYSKTNAGTYTVTAKLNNGYVWNDGSSGNVTFSCSIAKKNPTVVVSVSSLSINKGSSKTFNEKANTVGTFRNSSSNTNIVSVSPSNYSDVGSNTDKVVTVKGVNNGSGSITVSFTPKDTTNWNSVSKTVNISVSTSLSKVTKPNSSLCKNGLVYNGSTQQITNVTSGNGYSLSGYSKTNAGTYTVTAKLNNGYVWNDGSSGNVTFSCSIAKKNPTVVVSVSSLSINKGSSKTFNEKANTVGTFRNSSSNTNIVSVSPSNYSDVGSNIDKVVTVKGVNNGSGSITVSFTPKDTTNWNSVSKTVNISISTSSNGVMKPTEKICKSGLIYNGKEQQITNVTGGNGYSLSGYSKTNAGTYTVTAKLNNGYVWNDGSSGNVTFSCSIAKETPVLSLNLYSVVVVIPNKKKLTYSYNGDGKISCNMDNESIAKCSILDGEIVITPIAKGNTTVILNASEGVNYNKVSKKVNIIVSDSLDDVNTFIASFDANGGILKGDKEIVCNTNENKCKITELPVAIKEGYTFGGWGKSSECNFGSSSSLILNEDTTYYACYVNNADNLKKNKKSLFGIILIVLLCLALVGFLVYFLVKYLKRDNNSI